MRGGVNGNDKTELTSSGWADGNGDFPYEHSI